MPTKIYKPSQQTKNNILQKAIGLFNEHGTGVSLNALAEALGISTGNLQYHYRNKEEIIRSILEIMFNDWNAVYREMDSGSFNMDTLQRTLRVNFDLVWKYRFFYRELNALLRNDEMLARRYAVIQEQRIAEQVQLTKQIAKASGATPMSKLELQRMVVTGWILGNSWLSYVESTGRAVDQITMQEGIGLLTQFYKPYLEEIV